MKRQESVCLFLLQKHDGQCLITTQIIGSPVNFLLEVTACGGALMQRADPQVLPVSCGSEKLWQIYKQALFGYADYFNGNIPPKKYVKFTEVLS